MGTIIPFRRKDQPKLSEWRTIEDTFQRLPDHQLNVLLFYTVVPMDLIAEMISRGGSLMAANPFGQPIYYQQVIMAPPRPSTGHTGWEYMYDPRTQDFIHVDVLRDPVCASCAANQIADLLMHGWDQQRGWLTGEPDQIINYCSSCGKPF